jgi:aryl-alcohol dehydrogenase-like predicted oxidoreductase
MQYVDLGNTRLRVSRICLGCMTFGNEADWMLRPPEAKKVIARAVDLGINFFDTADVYSQGVSEEILGHELQGRSDTIVATKVGSPFGPGPDNSGLSERRVLRQAEGSITRLKRDRIDLYQIHRWDYRTPIEETLGALTNLVKEGKVAYIGASSMFAWQFMWSLAVSQRNNLESFVSMQNRYNLVYREEEREMIPFCRQFGIAVLPYSPLARGFLSGRYRRGEAPNSLRYNSDRWFKGAYFYDNDYEVLDVINQIAMEKRVKAPIIALAWLLSKPWVTAPIVGATREEHVDDAVAALSIKLSSEDIRRLEERYSPHQMRGPTRPEEVTGSLRP